MAEVIPMTAISKTEARAVSRERDLSIFCKALGLALGLARFSMSQRGAAIEEMMKTGLVNDGERTLLLQFFEKGAAT